MYQKAKPREDGPLETMSGDPPKMVSEVVISEFPGWNSKHFGAISFCRGAAQHRLRAKTTPLQHPAVFI